MREAEIARRETELRETEARLLGLVLDSKPDPKPGSKADSYENEFPPARRASAQAAVPTASTVCAPPRDALTPPPPPPPVITPPVITPRVITLPISAPMYPIPVDAMVDVSTASSPAPSPAAAEAPEHYDLEKSLEDDPALNELPAFFR
jgi:hypothetical protein